MMTNAPPLSKEALACALRHPATWPKGFKWDYSRPEKCAGGLLNTLWPGHSLGDLFSGALLHHIYWGVGLDAGVAMRNVTPGMVADEIEKVEWR